MKRFRLLAAAGVAVAVATSALAAGLYSTLPIVGGSSFCASTVSGTGNLGGLTGQGQGTLGSICGQTVPAGPPFLTGSELVPADTGLTGGAPPQTVVIPAPLLANMSGTPRNYLDNGSLNVQQRGTGTVTCGTTSGVPSSAYGPDRWGCDANVTSGAGRQAIVTTAALLPTGFTSVNTLFRTSGALTQPICSIQEVPTSKAIALAGKTVSLSVYAAALAGLAADNNNVITASIITGTGTDQGLGSMTASPAITPAWTGVASPLNQSQQTITTTPTRYAFPATTIPSTTTELAVAFCFTPTATGAGATDGFAWVGAQLEVAPSPSAYEFHDIALDLVTAQRYFWQLNSVSGAFQGSGACTATNVDTIPIFLPVQMRAAPTAAITAGAWQLVINGAAATGITGQTMGTSTVNNVTISATTACTAGQTVMLTSNGTTGVVTATADF